MMKPDIRLEILDVLRELGNCFPDMHFGQLVVNLAYQARDWTNEAIWDVEDDEFLNAAKEFLAIRRAHEEGVQGPSPPLPESSRERVESSRIGPGI